MKTNDLIEILRKYKPGKDSVIAATVEGDELVIYEVTQIGWESDYWAELERIKIV